MAQLKITWTKSCIGKPQDQRKVVQALGLRRLHHTVTHGDTPTIRGMVNKVSHLLTVEEIAEG
ncbi:MAG: 50S ribosomal protein L30 [Chloroflexi bacterium]|nr:50S ribosomal protein L30 [Chloroflexota bacterium]